MSSDSLQGSSCILHLKTNKLKVKKIEEAKAKRKQILKMEAERREAKIKRAVSEVRYPLALPLINILVLDKLLLVQLRYRYAVCLCLSLYFTVGVAIHSFIGIQAERLADAHTRKQASKIHYKTERTAQFVKTKQDSMKGNKREEQLKAKFREQRKLAAEERMEEQRELLTRRLKAKELHAEHVTAARHEQRVAKKTEQRLKITGRARKAQRLRMAAENKQKKQIERMQRFYEKQQQLEEIKHAIGERRKQVLREEKIRRDKWRAAITLERQIMPGPGEYELPSTLRNSGGTFNMSKPKTEMDWVRYRAKQLPAPGDYYNAETSSTLNKAGGSWSKYLPKSDVEIMMDRARKQPGPGEYSPIYKPDTTTAAFGDAEPMSEIDRVILNASRTPAPGQNQPDNVPKRAKKLKVLQQQFGVSKSAMKFAGRMKAKLGEMRSDGANGTGTGNDEDVTHRRMMRTQSAPPMENE